VVQASSKLKEQIAFDVARGNTVTAPGFYGPQGRIMRVANRYPEMLQHLCAYYHSSNFRLDNFEMETAGYYALGRILGHEMLSVNAILANRITKEFSREPGKVIETLIGKVLDRI
jgi:uridine phosphorylase